MELKQIFDEERPIAEVAELLGQTGLLLFPAREQGENVKAPYTRNGLDGATNSVDQIRAYWNKWPGAAIAVPTGSPNGFVVMDLDVKAGKNGIQSFTDYGADLTNTWAVRTPSDGMHLLYRNPPDFIVQNDVERRFGSGIDVRGERGYVIWPPSEISEGRYQFVRGQEPWNIRIADLPEIIDHQLRSPLPTMTRQQSQGRAIKAAEFFSPIAEGCRNQELTRRAGYLLRRYGPDTPVIRNWLHELNQKCCQPPLPSAEVDRIYKSIQRRELRNRG